MVTTKSGDHRERWPPLLALSIPCPPPLLLPPPFWSLSSFSNFYSLLLAMNTQGLLNGSTQMCSAETLGHSFQYAPGHGRQYTPMGANMPLGMASNTKKFNPLAVGLCQHHHQQQSRLALGSCCLELNREQLACCPITKYLDHTRGHAGVACCLMGSRTGRGVNWRLY